MSGVRIRRQILDVRFRQGILGTPPHIPSLIV